MDFYRFFCIIMLSCAVVAQARGEVLKGDLSYSDSAGNKLSCGYVNVHGAIIRPGPSEPNESDMTAKIQLQIQGKTGIRAGCRLINGMVEAWMKLESGEYFYQKVGAEGARFPQQLVSQFRLPAHSGLAERSAVFFCQLIDLHGSGSLADCSEQREETRPKLPGPAATPHFQ